MSGRRSFSSSGHDESYSRQPPAAHLGHVLRVGGGVQRHHQVEVRRAGGVAVLADADLVPGRQSLDVRREDVLAGDRDAHAEDGLHEQAVGAGRAGAVDRGDLEAKSLTRSIDLGSLRPLSAPLPASSADDLRRSGHSSTNLRMSHAAVGQRSAHSPQCRQTSSSFTITRWSAAARPRRTAPASRFTAGAISRGAQLRLLGVGRRCVRQSTGQMSMQASHSMHRLSVKCVCTSQLRQRCTSARGLLGR